MGLFDFLRKREETIIDENAVSDPLLQAIVGNTEITRQKALEIPCVSADVDLICNTFAMIPFKLYKESEKDGKRITEEVYDSRVDLINDDTKDKLDGFQFKKAICEDYLMGKGGYAYIQRKRNKVTGIYYVDEKNIGININADPIFKEYDINVNGETYKDFDFLKLLRNTKDGASGIGLTQQIENALKTAFKRLYYEYYLIVTGGSRKGFIKSQKHLDSKAIAALKSAWEAYYNGNANTVILNDGMEFQEASNNSQENEMDAKSKTFAAEMAEIFHIGQNYDDFIKNAIMPIAMAFTTALNRDLLLEREKGSFYFAPDLKELYKGSITERYNAYAVAIQNGFKTRNEIRYLEDDNAIDGLDTINLGLGDVLLNTETGQIYVPNTNKLMKMGENSMEVEENQQLQENTGEIPQLENQDIPENQEGGEKE